MNLQFSRFPDRQLQISDSKISTKSIEVFHFEFSYCTCRKIVWNLLIQQYSMKKLYFKMHSDSLQVNIPDYR